MNRTNKILGVLILFILAACLAAYLSVDEQREIRRLFETAASLASFEGEEHPFAKLGVAQELSALFADQAVLEIRRPDRIDRIVSSRREIRDKLLGARTGLAQLAVSLADFDVRLSGDGARVLVTVRAMGRDEGRSDYFLEVRRMDCRVTKEDGHWRIQYAVNVEPYVEE